MSTVLDHALMLLTFFFFCVAYVCVSYVLVFIHPIPNRDPIAN